MNFDPLESRGQGPEHSIADLELRRGSLEVRLSFPPVPAAVLHQATDKVFPVPAQFHHAAVVVRDQTHDADPADRDRVGELEFDAPEIASAGPQDKGEVLRDAEHLAVIHAHRDEHLGLRVGSERAAQVVIGK